MSNKDNKPQVEIEIFYFRPVKKANDEPFQIEFFWRIKDENLRRLNVELIDPTGKTLTNSSELEGTYVSDLPFISSEYRLTATAAGVMPANAALTVQINNQAVSGAEDRSLLVSGQNGRKSVAVISEQKPEDVLPSKTSGL